MEGDNKPTTAPNNSSNGKDQQKEVVEAEILKDLPENQRKLINQIFSSISVQGAFPKQNPILTKITPEHITTVLDHSNQEDLRDREERKSERDHNYKIMVTAIIAITIIGSLLVYSNQTDILKYVVGAVFGFAGGFGAGKYYDKE